MSFEEQVKEWVSIDNQIQIYAEKMKELKERRSNISNKIVNIDNFDTQLCNKTLQISDGHLKFVNTRVSSSLTFTYVKKSLHNIIKNDKQVDQIIRYLKENREIKTVSEIKRYS